MSDHDKDFEFESQPGLPKPLPPGEELLWQGSPDPATLAREAFKLAAQKLPIKTKFVSRADLEGGVV